MIKGAIFDFDGTLVDSMFIWDTFGEDYLRTLGKEPRENLPKPSRHSPSNKRLNITESITA